jgi:hypothetical protein
MRDRMEALYEHQPWRHSSSTASEHEFADSAPGKSWHRESFYIG